MTRQERSVRLARMAALAAKIQADLDALRAEDAEHGRAEREPMSD